MEGFRLLMGWCVGGLTACQSVKSGRFCNLSAMVVDGLGVFVVVHPIFGVAEVRPDGSAATSTSVDFFFFGSGFLCQAVAMGSYGGCIQAMYPNGRLFDHLTCGAGFCLL
jgi:hypothetical protein